MFDLTTAKTKLGIVGTLQDTQLQAASHANSPDSISFNGYTGNLARWEVYKV